MSKRGPSILPITLSLTTVLLLLGLLGALTIHTSAFTRHFKENIVVLLFFNKQAPDATIEESRAIIEDKSYIKRSEFISAEDAAYTFKDELGKDFVDILGDNPLPSSMELYLDLGSTSMKIDAILDDLEAVPYVYEVEFEKHLIEKINKNTKIIAVGLIFLSLLLMIVSVILINNLVRLSVYSKRFIVKSMQLVGATEWFIIKPFLLRSLLVVAIGATLAWLLSFGITWVAYSWLRSIYSQTNSGNLPNFGDITGISEYSFLFVALLLVGIIIVLPTTFLSTRKYLRMKIDDLY